MHKIFGFALLIACLVVSPAFASTSNGKVFLIHAKTSMKLDDAQICAVPNVAWSALLKGYEVIILFDASGVTAIKNGGIFGGPKTPIDKAALPARERQSLSSQFEIPLKDVPKNYGEYFRFLKFKKGVKLYANNTMMLLYKIDKKQIEPAVIPIDLNKMINIFESANVYVAY